MHLIKVQTSLVLLLLWINNFATHLCFGGGGCDMSPQCLPHLYFHSKLWEVNQGGRSWPLVLHLNCELKPDENPGTKSPPLAWKQVGWPCLLYPLPRSMDGAWHISLCLLLTHLWQAGPGSCCKWNLKAGLCFCYELLTLSVLHAEES